jgi:hypothetical protein
MGVIVGGIARGATDEAERRKMMFQVRPLPFLVHFRVNSSVSLYVLSTAGSILFLVDAADHF